jgi:SAM-dependent methyltransferase
VDSLDEFLDPRATPVTLDSFGVRRAILRALQAELPNLTGAVLDIGCGYMPYKSLLLAPPSRATRYIGLDLTASLYRSKPDLTWDGRNIPLPEAAVDCAVATEVLEHCSAPDVVLREILRVLKPGGRLFLTVPFLWPLHDVPYDEYRYTPFALERHLASAGFVGIRLQALGGWDASLAQMIGLWVRGRPMSRSRRRALSRLAVPVVRWLLRWDRLPESFTENVMITGLSGTAEKPAA